MDSISEFLSSGIIEMYCLGLATEEETAQVVHLASLHQEVRDEIDQVTDSLTMYAANLKKQPSASLRSIILEGIETSHNVNLPPKLLQNTSIVFWKNYLKEKGINPPADFDPFFLAELPSDSIQYTYVAWAKNGANLEETHDDENEWLFVLQGTCTMTVNGKVSHHKAGDLIAIPRQSLHKAEATSDDMILVGQRIAA